MAAAEPFERLPLLLRYRQPAGVTGVEAGVTLYGQYLRPRAEDAGAAGTCLVMMHPNGVLHGLRLPAALAAAGCHVVCCASRFIKNDSTLLMEAVAVDLGAVVRHCLRARGEGGLGFGRVALVAWSGGASLGLFYQSQAERATVEATPGGLPFRLAAADLPRAAGVCTVAGHCSRALLLAEWLDPAVGGEGGGDPDAPRDASLDLYAPGRGPLTPEWLARFRAAQRERMLRITAWVRERLPRGDRAFVVHGTMAEPRWLDASLDPNDRAEGRCFFGDPEQCNTKPGGMARFCSLHSWLSQWSPDDTNCNGVVHGARLRDTPVLMVAHSADDICAPSHTDALWRSLDGLDDSRKRFVTAPGAGHGDAPPETVDAVLEFVRGLAGN